MNAREAYKLLSPLWRRLRLLISRGVVGRTDSGTGLQRLQMTLLKGETRNLEHMEPYGFTSRPLKGAETIAAAVGGARGHLVALVASDRRHRRKGLAEGEVALYTDEGDEIVLKRGRVIAVTAGTAIEVTAPSVSVACDTAEVTASASVTLDTPETGITGNVQIGGNLTVAGLITGQGGMAISGGGGASFEGDMAVSGGDVSADGISLKGHVHGGVQTGGGNTGAAQ